MNKQIYNEIYDYIKSIEIIDTHEHLPAKESYRDKNNDVFTEYLIHYFSTDLVSSGISKESCDKLRDKNVSIEEKWKIVEPYWENCRYTGYGRSLDITAKGLYNIESINGKTIGLLNDKIKNSFNENHYNYVLKEKSKIKTSILDFWDVDLDKNYFTISYNINSMLAPRSYEDIVNLSWQIRITSFDDYIDALDAKLEWLLSQGINILKCSSAYERNLVFAKVTKAQAEADFIDAYSKIHYPNWSQKQILLGKNFQDYIMHYILRFANNHGWVVQIHTGLQEGNGNILQNSDPLMLSNLFLEYTNVKFDIFHISYPFEKVLVALCKNFPNVYIDMCWAHIISPNASVNLLLEYIDAVPLNKISAFGGDYCFVDAVYGHSILARENVSKALAIKVEDGIFGIDKACEIGNMMLFKNPSDIFLCK